MIPDLDKYAATVLGAYGISLLLIAVLILVSARRAAKVRDALARTEAEVKGNRNGRP